MKKEIFLSFRPNYFRTILYDRMKARLEKYIESGERYAIPIKTLQLYIDPISIRDLKNIDPTFKIPRGYLDITKYERLHERLKSQTMHQVEFYNNHDITYIENIGYTCLL